MELKIKPLVNLSLNTLFFFLSFLNSSSAAQMLKLGLGPAAGLAATFERGLWRLLLEVRAHGHRYA